MSEDSYHGVRVGALYRHTSGLIYQVLSFHKAHKDDRQSAFLMYVRFIRVYINANNTVVQLSDEEYVSSFDYFIGKVETPRFELME